MTQLFDVNNCLQPVTVIEAEPCCVSQIKTEEKDGYKAVQIAYQEKNQINKPTAGRLEKANISEQTINSIESKRLWPSDKTLSKITTALEIDIFKLFFPEKDSGFPSKELDADLSHSVVQSIRNLVESTLREYTK